MTMKDIPNKLNTDGFVVIDGFLSEDEIQLFKNEGQNFTKNLPEQSKRTVFSTTDSETQQNKDKYFLDSAHNISYFYEKDALSPSGELLVSPDVSLNKVGHALHVQNDVFRKITFDERVKEICFQLGFEDPALVQSMYIYKNPGIGGEVTPHQDATYLYTEPNNLIGFWFPLDDATIENGCLWFVRGSHKGGTHRRYTRNPNKESDELLVYDKPAPHYQKNNFTSVPVEKGACVLIHGQVVHYSPPNKSDKSRNAYTFHVIERKNTVYAEDNWLQPDEEHPFLSLYQN